MFLKQGGTVKVEILIKIKKKMKHKTDLQELKPGTTICCFVFLFSCDSK